MPRASGVLLHPTSLPGRHGIGDLGSEAYRFVDFLADAGQTYWQILPLGPTGYGDSPYQTFSAFAGHPALVSPDLLARDGFASPTTGDGDSAPSFPDEQVDYGRVIPYKRAVIERSFDYVEAHGGAAMRREIDDFAAAHRSWLDDFALFMALKDAHGGAPWTAWEEDIATREPEAMKRWRERLSRETRLHVYAQFVFFRQWVALKEYAASRGIRIIGDAPIFVAHDSADCWSRREMFYLRPDGQPEVVAGVPPDYFSSTGQRWGNPLYRWDVMARDNFAWWIERLRTTLRLVDVLRLDHFRGFAGYWAIPGNAPTAEKGAWEPGPGAAFFDRAQEALGPLPLIAEDLGVITPDVVALRDRYNFPGMKILQFAFGGDADNQDLPHNYSANYVVYTGTHDNDTTVGWFARASAKERAHALAYMGSDGTDPAGDLIRLAMASVADTAVVPLQDLLRLGSAARMNLPAVTGGNWSWRFLPGALSPALREQIREQATLYGRARQRPTTGQT